ncbi:hypothetical protein pb186bvf_017150 [Paramecium bursaria]
MSSKKKINQFMNDRMNERKERYQLIRSQPAFQGLGHDMIKRICQIAIKKDYGKNSIVYKENEFQENAHIVKSGEFKMIKKVSKTYEDQLFIVRPRLQVIEICILQYAEIFGIENFDDTFLNKNPYSVICCTTDGSTLAINLKLLYMSLQQALILSPLSKIFNTHSQIVKNNVYKYRERQLQLFVSKQQNQQESHQRSRSQNIKLVDYLQKENQDNVSTTPKRMSPDIRKDLRSQTKEYSSYEEKIHQITRGNTRVHKQRRRQISTENNVLGSNDMNEKIQEIRSRIYSEQASPAKSMDQLQRIKILHQLANQSQKY